MEFIIENVTDEEVDILEKNDIDWCPDTIEGNDAAICVHNRTEIGAIMKLIGREVK